MEYFAGYGFNKSHSAAYALISYQTAFLKTYYPVEFMAALLTSEKDNTDNVVKYITEAKAMGINVLPPDVNESDMDFTVSEGKIRFGLGAVKQVGGAALDSILEARKKGGFTSLFDFCEQADLRRVNRRVIEALVKCGAFDFLHVHRASLFATIDLAIDRAQQAQKDRESGQMSLFGGLVSEGTGKKRESQDDYMAAEEWPSRKRLALEKDALGFYITGHPLDRYKPELPLYTTATSYNLDQFENKAQVSMCGVAASIREKTLRDGSGKMAFIKLEDQYGQVEVLTFSKVYGQYESLLKDEEILIVTGQLQFEGDEEPKTPKIRAEHFWSIQQAREKHLSQIVIQLDSATITREKIIRLNNILLENKGTVTASILIRFENGNKAYMSLPKDYTVTVTEDLIRILRKNFGEDTILFKSQRGPQ
jgi:DNA polymerase-3 subunit alpha